MWGPLGVALAAARLSSPTAIIKALSLELSGRDRAATDEDPDDPNALVGEFDAAKWAAAFVERARTIPDFATDEGNMIGWFANAIMAGYDHARREKSEPEVVVLPRDALFQFFGEMALPPWQDERGRTIGGKVECAPLAERITRWVETHDLTDTFDLAPRVVGGSPG